MENLIYLDSGATTFPKPEDVHVAMGKFFRCCGANPGRSGYDLCMVAGFVVEETRKLLTQFFNGTDPSRLIFAYDATNALNLAIFGILKEGDHAITSNIEHNSVIRPLYHLYKYGGVEPDYVPFDGQGFLDPEEFARRFKKNTKLVAIETWWLPKIQKQCLYQYEFDSEGFTLVDEVAGYCLSGIRLWIERGIFLLIF